MAALRRLLNATGDLNLINVDQSLINLETLRGQFSGLLTINFFL